MTKLYRKSSEESKINIKAFSNEFLHKSFMDDAAYTYVFLNVRLFLKKKTLFKTLLLEFYISFKNIFLMFRSMQDFFRLFRKKIIFDVPK